MGALDAMLAELGDTDPTRPPVPTVAADATAVAPPAPVRRARKARQDATALKAMLAELPQPSVGETPAQSTVQIPTPRGHAQELNPDGSDKLMHAMASAVNVPGMAVDAAKQGYQAAHDVKQGNYGRAALSAGVMAATTILPEARTAYRSALVTPYAEIERAAPELANALLAAGAGKKRAQHIAERRLPDFVLKGLTEEQRGQFGAKLVLDNLEAEAARKAASDPAAAARFAQHAADLAPRVPAGIEQEPWFQQALAGYKQHVEGPLTDAAIRAGVDPTSLRQPATAYVKLSSRARLDDAEIRRAMDHANATDPAKLKERPAALKKLIGEDPALSAYFAQGAKGPRQGPLTPGAGYPGEPGPFTGKQVGVTGSARQAQGTAQEYATDLSRIVTVDARDKAVKAARNQVWSEVAKVGRQLEAKEAPAPGMRVLSFSDKKGLVTGDEGTLRYEVAPEIHAAVTKFYRNLEGEPRSHAGKALRSLADVATRAQIAGMPVEATSHANTLASIIAKVPGEKDAAGKALAMVPLAGSKAAAIREMMQMDFADPATRALENRLADIGALRIETHRGGLINTSHHWLFGPEGVDVRGRLVLARKYLAKKPAATDAELREFVNSKLGNYISENSGALTNFMAKGSVLSPFARFQSARIPTSVQTTLGQSGLPTTGVADKLKDMAQTLYRGPVGYAAGANALNVALTGQRSRENEPGHALDVSTGLSAVPGGMRKSLEDDKASDHAAPLYIPAATLDPVAYAGLRATGLKSLLFDPDIPANGKSREAVRDALNVGLGTAGPFVRAVMTATTGTQPYLQRDGTFLRVAPRRFSGNRELVDQVKTAAGLANPALHAFTSSGGDAARKMSGAMAEDGKPLGGVASTLARLAEFTFPRVLSPGIGGRTNEQSADAQMARAYDETLREYAREVRQAPGPKAREEVIQHAIADAERAGFRGSAVRVALQKAVYRNDEKVASAQHRQVQKKLDKVRK